MKSHPSTGNHQSSINHHQSLIIINQSSINHQSSSINHQSSSITTNHPQSSSIIHQIFHHPGAVVDHVHIALRLVGQGWIRHGADDEGLRVPCGARRPGGGGGGTSGGNPAGLAREMMIFYRQKWWFDRQKLWFDRQEWWLILAKTVIRCDFTSKITWRKFGAWQAKIGALQQYSSNAKISPDMGIQPTSNHRSGQMLTCEEKIVGSISFWAWTSP